MPVLSPVILGDSVNNSFRLAQGLLNVAIDSLNANVPATQPAPERSYVYHGDPPYEDRDMLAIFIDQPRPSFTFPEQYTGPILTPFFWVADLIVTLVRPYPYPTTSDGTLLDPAVISEASRIVYADGHCVYWSIVTTLVALRQAGCFDYYTFSALKPIAPEGGAAGWVFTITTEISGNCTCLGDLDA